MEGYGRPAYPPVQHASARVRRVPPPCSRGGYYGGWRRRRAPPPPSHPAPSWRPRGLRGGVIAASSAHREIFTRAGGELLSFYPGT
ncbi:hypothetical protein C4D60_Mb00t20040 [Musa balbisiana]|uniref:Uncharacterized protein n=1 Tax=Musa balbisiana TaxID=52838 RepID=A0A4S8I3U9_MUSBA|nr:hypothetical protein C4D60_Mb00t20040 [Musa balbisiana]